jgi:hypothetical protein
MSSQFTFTLLANLTQAIRQLTFQPGVSDVAATRRGQLVGVVAPSELAPTVITQLTEWTSQQPRILGAQNGHTTIVVDAATWQQLKEQQRFVEVL